MKINRDDMVAFVNSNAFSLKKRNIVGTTLLTLLISLPVILWNTKNFFTLFIFGLCDLTLITFAIRLLLYKTVNSRQSHLFAGSVSFYASIELICLAYNFMIFLWNAGVFYLLFMFCLLCVHLTLVFLWFLHSIKKGIYRTSQSSAKITVISPLAGGVLGMLVARHLPQTQVTDMVMVFAILFLALLISLGTGCLIKFYFQIKYDL